MVSELAAMMSRLTDRATYVFPGETLHWDVEPHAMTITCATTLIGPMKLVLAPAWEPVTHRRWLPIYLLIGGVILLGIGLVARRGSSRA